ncbi:MULTISPECIES: hypothetical protein [Kitasatospora]|nr:MULTISPECIES: hypothetical protein [Kitasatospora]
MSAARDPFALLGGDCVAISCPVGGRSAAGGGSEAGQRPARYEAREGEE